ncbi:hypothetical protein SAMN04487895_101685 [Paenibacillus sophorae]|uniref:Uncharacterized protein n=1 Tax=Paenibacillus sophorae TaxID=1333845 RepID=A0A1H8GXN5_9BACL|nr:hypothetical protein [Paenibacillus sophorae]QWU14379.1 hypothetical protein KP014_20955 [Paenibacillus sophorae]SEN48891.1 hypothetical protein SAMN04487895_101685 [Paenibacillus sophorae]
MEKDIQQIIKAAAERYGLGYDPNQKQAIILQSDGSIGIINDEDIAAVFRDMARH